MRNQIQYILLCACGGLCLITLIVLIYGAYLFDMGLISKSDIFVTAIVPLLAAILTLFGVKR